MSGYGERRSFVTHGQYEAGGGDVKTETLFGLAIIYSPLEIY